jgi:hypothetical protein
MNRLNYNSLRASRLSVELGNKLEQEVISSCEGASRFELFRVLSWTTLLWASWVSVVALSFGSNRAAELTNILTV